MKRLIIPIVLVLSVISVIAQDNYQPVPYTLADRDRLIKVEAQLGALDKRVDQMDQSLNNRIDMVEQSLNNRIDKVTTALIVLKISLIHILPGVLDLCLGLFLPCLGLLSMIGVQPLHL
ncbi:MAG: hypothetical protein B6D64_02195 [Bacteroidetes bacterium 4484_276]|nr:MAG: hypothetical protein B6D64_02195 [Bacteroidetes bacterium 4484_276]